MFTLLKTSMFIILSSNIKEVAFDKCFFSKSIIYFFYKIYMVKTCLNRTLKLCPIFQISATNKESDYALHVNLDEKQSQSLPQISFNH